MYEGAAKKISRDLHGAIGRACVGSKAFQREGVMKGLAVGLFGLAAVAGGVLTVGAAAAFAAELAAAEATFGTFAIAAGYGGKAGQGVLLECRCCGQVPNRAGSRAVPELTVPAERPACRAARKACHQPHAKQSAKMKEIVSRHLQAALQHP